MTTLEYITKRLSEIYRTASTDRYGQVGKFNLTPVNFGERSDEVIEFAKANPDVLTLSTYGGRVGTYQAFDIRSQQLKEVMTEALSKNKNRESNLNSW